jgi:hypothetical protein
MIILSSILFHYSVQYFNDSASSKLAQTLLLLAFIRFESGRSIDYRGWQISHGLLSPSSQIIIIIIQ